MIPWDWPYHPDGSKAVYQLPRWGFLRYRRPPLESGQDSVNDGSIPSPFGQGFFFFGVPNWPRTRKPVYLSGGDTGALFNMKCGEPNQNWIPFPLNGIGKMERIIKIALPADLKDKRSQ